MTNTAFVQGVLILLKYVGPNQYDIHANSTHVYFGPENASDVSQADAATLNDLGWLVDCMYNRWSCFTSP